MHIACYLRVSTEEQNVNLQEDALKKFCDFKWPGISPVFFVDQGESGAKISRPALDRMLADARAGKFDAIVTWKFDRIGRSALHLLTIMEELRGLKVSFISLQESIDTSTDAGKMFFAILAAIAEFERSTIISRTKAGIEAAQARGIHCGKPDSIAPEVKERVLAGLAEGIAPNTLADAFGISRATVYRIKKRVT